MKRLVVLAFAFICSVASAQDRGFRSEGREFFLGYLHPTVGPMITTSNGGSYDGQYKVYALVSSSQDNEVHVSYYNPNGSEAFPTVYRVAAGTTHILLDRHRMRHDSFGDKAAFLACHITARRPIAIQYFSTGPGSCGSYLALPVHSWGLKHVVASYNDHFFGIVGGPDHSPFYTSGIFTIVAAHPGTVVTIIPTAQTCGGHSGVNQGPGANGTPQPYKINLSRGECYFVRSASSLLENSDDLSGSIVLSNYPVAVIAGHENANVGDGGVLTQQPYDIRDFMIEQMIPVEFWDNTGFVSIPNRDSEGPIIEGVGENYRLYVADQKVPSPVLGNGTSYYPGTFAAPIELTNRTTPISFSALPDTSRFMAVQYDLRSHGTGVPFTAPTMSTLIPKSQWRTSYAWSFPFKGDQFHGCAKHYVTVICEADKFSEIMVSVDNSAPKPIGNALKSVQKTWNTGQIPDFPEMKAVTYSIAASINGAGGRYKATASFPFMVYHFGSRQSSTHYLECGLTNSLQYYYSYASPGGASLFDKHSHNKLVYTIDTLCTGAWKVCVSAGSNSSIRHISLLDDSGGNLYAGHSYQYSNVSILAPDDPLHIGEITLPGNDQSYCFTIGINDPAKASYAPVIVYDNAGNYKIIELRKSPQQLTISPDPFTNPDLFKGAKFGEKVCTTFTLRNDASNTTSYVITSAVLGGSKFSIPDLAAKLPASIEPGDSLKFDVCFESTDSSFFETTLTLTGTCLDIRIPLRGSTVRPILSADDTEFGKVLVGKTVCKNVTLTNPGDADLIIAGGAIVQSGNEFSFSPTTTFPITIAPGEVAQVRICYTPDTVGGDEAWITWQTNVTAPFPSEHKPVTNLSGEGFVEDVGGVREMFDHPVSIRPNPAHDKITVEIVLAEQADVEVMIFDVLGREVLSRTYENLTGHQQVVVALPSLTEGMYFARINVDGAIKTLPFEVRK